MPTDDALRPTHVTVDLGAIRRNLAAIGDHVGTASVMPVLKANAYGHGLAVVATNLAATGVSAFAVAYLEEAETLRRAGLDGEILVLSGPISRQIPRLLSHGLTIAVPSVRVLDEVQHTAAARGVIARVHLKFDTGMGRLGQGHAVSTELLDAAHRAPNVEVTGVFSHFATADEADLTFANTQLERFLEILSWYERHDLEPPIRHMANSGAILQLPESHLDMVRAGILLYGVYPSDECRTTVRVEPALSWHSQVVFSKVVEPGDPVSYGATWTPAHSERVVTLPVGYGDGYLRANSNRAEALIDGARCPVVGRVCMDHTMVSLGEGAPPHDDAPVVLLGRQGDEEITAAELANHAGTIPYEILTSINARVPRVYK